MQLEERVVGDVTVLALSGRMTRDEEYEVLKQKVGNLVQEGRRKLVLNLAAVTYLDSTCIGEIVSGLVTVRNSGGALHLANLTQRLERLMTMAGLMSLFQTFGSEQEAVQSLAPAAGES